MESKKNQYTGDFSAIFPHACEQSADKKISKASLPEHSPKTNKGDWHQVDDRP
jgi:hypothetical protein